MSGARSYAFIPGPKPLPFLGNSWRFALGRTPWKTRALDITLWTLRALAGPGGAAKVAKLFGHPDLVFPFCAEEVAKIYRREDIMPHRALAPCLKHYKQELRKDFFGDEPGLIGIHGQPWSKFRSSVSKALIAPEAARAAVPDLDCVTDDFVSRMESIVDHNRELPKHFLTELYKWALESVGVWALGTRLGCFNENDAEAKQIIKCIHGFFHSVPELELSAPLWRLYSTPAYRTYVEALDSFRSLCLNRITDKGVCAQIAEQSGERVASILALDLLLVGVDTTAAAAASTIYLLANNKRAQKRLQDEIQHTLPKGRKIICNDLNKMVFLKACIKEALRIKPVILGNGRCIQTDAVISGYRVPKGTHVVFPHYILSNEERYFPSPHEYVPERWLREIQVVEKYVQNKKEYPKKVELAACSQSIPESEEINSIVEKSNACNRDRAYAVWRKQKEMGIHPFASLPFGFGRRMCIGKRFAEVELQLLLAKIASLLLNKYLYSFNVTSNLKTKIYSCLIYLTSVDLEIFERYDVSWRYGELTYSVTPTYIPNEPLQFKLKPINLRNEGNVRT